MRWGIYDTRDNCWIGDDAGPQVFEDHLLARISAQVMEDMLYGSDLGGRLVAKELNSNALRLKDEVPVKHSAIESLRRIEGTKQ